MQRQGDDSFYLTHDSDGNESFAGAIFTESAYNSTTMEDPVTVAYGHQMHAGTMFGKLQETYSQEDALEDYGEVIVYLPEKELHYQVFAAVPYDNRHILYNYDCTDSRRFNAFLKQHLRSPGDRRPVCKRRHCLHRRQSAGVVHLFGGQLPTKVSGPGRVPG